MTVNVKFTKFDNTPWGFRLAGGSDFPHPLTVIKVAEGGLAECMGLKVGDVVVRLNDEPVSGLTHGQAHEALLRAGNNFVLGVKREEDPLKALEALNEENIVPYQIPLADLPPVFPEQILKEEAPIERPVEEKEQPRIQEEEEEKPLVEELPDKPRDADSEVVPNQNLTDDEIAQLILEEEELLSDQGVLGVNFKKLRPRVPVLKESKVLEELQHIATEEPPRVQELKHQSTFLQKPERPVPTPRKPEKEPVHQEEPEPYRVVIKKQQRRSVTDRLLERGLLKPSRTPEPPQAEVNMAAELQEHDYPPVNESSRDGMDGLRRKEASRRPIPGGRRRSKRFYTRANYFRRCVLGGRSHGDTRRPSRPRSAVLKERSSECLATTPGGQDRRVSVTSPEPILGRLKGRYLETCLKREQAWLKETIAGLLERVFSTDSTRRLPGNRLASFRKTRYAERLLLGSVEFVVACLLGSGENGVERKTTLKRVVSALTESRKTPEGLRFRNGRFYFKGRYFQRVLSDILASLGRQAREAFTGSEVVHARGRRRSSVIKMKGRYMEKCLERSQIVSLLMDALENVLNEIRGVHQEVPSFSANKRRHSIRTHYGERIVKRQFGSLGQIATFIQSKVVSGPDNSVPGYEGPLERDQVEVCDKDEGFSSFLRSSKDYVATEVFHRGSRRLSRSSRRSFCNVDEPGWPETLKRQISLWSGVSFRLGSTGCEDKIAREPETDGRRLSFVPTILYEGLTNRIGVDFTRLAAYAFVPCASVVLLYMYK